MVSLPAIADVIESEKALWINELNTDLALNLGIELANTARIERLPISIEVAIGSWSVFMACLQGSSQDNWDWVLRKRAVASRFQHSSLYMRVLCDDAKVDFHSRYCLPSKDFAPYGGALPLMLKGEVCVATVSVSGLTELQDHEFAVKGTSEFLHRNGIAFPI